MQGLRTYYVWAHDGIMAKRLFEVEDDIEDCYNALHRSELKAFNNSGSSCMNVKIPTHGLEHLNIYSDLTCIIIIFHGK